MHKKTNPVFFESNMRAPHAWLLVILISLVFASCSTGPRVKRLSADSDTDLTGQWNDTDARIVCQSLVADLLVKVSAYIQDFTRLNGRPPVVVFTVFENTTREHIDTGIIARQMEIAIENSGQLRFTAGGEVRRTLRAERQDQLGWTSEESAISLGNETAANLELRGSVRSVGQRSGGTQIVRYYVGAELWDLESNLRIWIQEDSSIKKEIKYAAFRP